MTTPTTSSGPIVTKEANASTTLPKKRPVGEERDHSGKSLKKKRLSKSIALNNNIEHEKDEKTLFGSVLLRTLVKKMTRNVFIVSIIYFVIKLVYGYLTTVVLTAILTILGTAIYLLHKNYKNKIRTMEKANQQAILELQAKLERQYPSGLSSLPSLTLDLSNIPTNNDATKALSPKRMNYSTRQNNDINTEDLSNTQFLQSDLSEIPISLREKDNILGSGSFMEGRKDEYGSEILSSKETLSQLYISNYINNALNSPKGDKSFHPVHRRIKDFHPREILEKAWLVPTEVAMEINNFIEIIMNNFIFEWYHSISFDVVFIDDVRCVLVDAFGKIINRIRYRLHSLSMIFDKLIPVIGQALKTYKEMRTRAIKANPAIFKDSFGVRALSKNKSEGNSSRSYHKLFKEQQRAILKEYEKSGNYHRVLKLSWKTWSSYKVEKKIGSSSPYFKLNEDFSSDQGEQSNGEKRKYVDLYDLFYFDESNVNPHPNTNEVLRSAEFEYLRSISSLFTRLLLNDRDHACKSIRHLARELLITCFFLPIANLLSTESLNDWILSAIRVLTNTGLESDISNGDETVKKGLTPDEVYKFYRPGQIPSVLLESSVNTNQDSLSSVSNQNLSKDTLDGSLITKQKQQSDNETYRDLATHDKLKKEIIAWRCFAGAITKPSALHILEGKRIGTYLIRKVKEKLDEENLYEILYVVDLINSKDRTNGFGSSPEKNKPRNFRSFWDDFTSATNDFFLGGGDKDIDPAENDDFSQIISTLNLGNTISNNEDFVNNTRKQNKNTHVVKKTSNSVIAIISAHLRISFEKYEYAERDWYFYEHIFTLVEGFDNLSKLLDLMKDKCMYPLDFSEQSVRKIREAKNSILSDSNTGKDRSALEKNNLIEIDGKQNKKKYEVENRKSSGIKDLQTFLENFEDVKERDDEDKDNASTDFSVEDDDLVDEEEDDIDETIGDDSETLQDMKMKSKQGNTVERIDQRKIKSGEGNLEVDKGVESSQVQYKSSNINENLPDPIDIVVLPQNIEMERRRKIIKEEKSFLLEELHAALDQVLELSKESDYLMILFKSDEQSERITRRLVKALLGIVGHGIVIKKQELGLSDIENNKQVHSMDILSKDSSDNDHKNSFAGHSAKDSLTTAKESEDSRVRNDSLDVSLESFQSIYNPFVEEGDINFDRTIYKKYKRLRNQRTFEVLSLLLSGKGENDYIKTGSNSPTSKPIGCEQKQKAVLQKQNINDDSIDRNRNHSSLNDSQFEGGRWFSQSLDNSDTAKNVDKQEKEEPSEVSEQIPKASKLDPVEGSNNVTSSRPSSPRRYSHSETIGTYFSLEEKNGNENKNEKTQNMFGLQMNVNSVSEDINNMVGSTMESSVGIFNAMTDGISDLSQASVTGISSAISTMSNTVVDSIAFHSSQTNTKKQDDDYYTYIGSLAINSALEGWEQNWLHRALKELIIDKLQFKNISISSFKELQKRLSEENGVKQSLFSPTFLSILQQHGYSENSFFRDDLMTMKFLQELDRLDSICLQFGPLKNSLINIHSNYKPTLELMKEKESKQRRVPCPGESKPPRKDSIQIMGDLLTNTTNGITDIISDSNELVAKMGGNLVNSISATTTDTTNLLLGAFAVNPGPQISTSINEVKGVGKIKEQQFGNRFSLNKEDSTSSTSERSSASSIAMNKNPDIEREKTPEQSVRKPHSSYDYSNSEIVYSKNAGLASFNRERAQEIKNRVKKRLMTHHDLLWSEKNNQNSKDRRKTPNRSGRNRVPFNLFGKRVHLPRGRSQAFDVDLSTDISRSESENIISTPSRSRSNTPSPRHSPRLNGSVRESRFSFNGVLFMDSENVKSIDNGENSARSWRTTEQVFGDKNIAKSIDMKNPGSPVSTRGRRTSSVDFDASLSFLSGEREMSSDSGPSLNIDEDDINNSLLGSGRVVNIRKYEIAARLQALLFSEGRSSFKYLKQIEIIANESPIMGWEVSVKGVDIISPKNSSSYYAFAIEVTPIIENTVTNDDPLNHDSLSPYIRGKSWLIKRRYSDFVKLDKQIRSQVSLQIINENMIALPPKHVRLRGMRLAGASIKGLVRGKIGSGVILQKNRLKIAESRVSKLHEYLQCLLNPKKSKDEYQAHISARSGIHGPVGTKLSSMQEVFLFLTHDREFLNPENELEYVELDPTSSIKNTMTDEVIGLSILSNMDEEASIASTQKSETNATNVNLQAKGQESFLLASISGFRFSHIDKMLFFLFDEIFETEKLSMVRRNLLSLFRGAAETFITGSLNKQIVDTYFRFTSTTKIASGLTWLRRFIFPAGKFVSRTPRTQQEVDSTRCILFEILRQDLIPLHLGTLQNLLGNDATENGILGFVDALQSPFFLKNLSYIILDILLLELFPELGIKIIN